MHQKKSSTMPQPYVAVLTVADGKVLYCGSNHYQAAVELNPGTVYGLGSTEDAAKQAARANLQRELDRRAGILERRRLNGHVPEAGVR